MECADGQPTGIGLSRGTSDDLVIYMAGGGACWDHQSCYEQERATFIAEGFGAAEFGDESPDLSEIELFDRDASDNPDDDPAWADINP